VQRSLVSFFERFSNFYFESEKRGVVEQLSPQHKQTVFLIEDKIKICEMLERLLSIDYAMSIIDIADKLSAIEQPGIEKKFRNTTLSRHKGRLNIWLRQYREGTLKMENAIAVKKEPKQTTAPVDDIAKFKRNLIESAKSICHSALKNNLTEEEVQIIFNSGLITAKEERKVQETKGALQAFLREKGITKDIAMQILETA
jgi:hypothetical protein